MRIEALLQYSPGCFACEQLADPRFPENLGKIRCFGGKQEDGETPAQTIIREAMEEYGLEIREAQIGPEVDLQALEVVDYARRFIVYVNRDDVIGRKTIEGDGTTLVQCYSSPAPWKR